MHHSQQHLLQLVVKQLLDSMVALHHFLINFCKTLTINLYCQKVYDKGHLDHTQHLQLNRIHLVLSLLKMLMRNFVFIVVNNGIQIIQYVYTCNNNSVLEKVTFSLTTTR